MGKVTGPKLLAVAVAAGLSFVGLPHIGIPVGLIMLWFAIM